MDLLTATHDGSPSKVSGHQPSTVDKVGRVDKRRHPCRAAAVLVHVMPPANDLSSQPENSGRESKASGCTPAWKLAMACDLQMCSTLRCAVAGIQQTKMTFAEASKCGDDD